MNQNDVQTAAQADAILRVLVLRQWEPGTEGEAVPWNVWVFVADEDDEELAVGHVLVGPDSEPLWFERIDDAYRYVRECGYRHGIRIEDQVVEADDHDDV